MDEDLIHNITDYTLFKLKNGNWLDRIQNQSNKIDNNQAYKSLKNANSFKLLITDFESDYSLSRANRAYWTSWGTPYKYNYSYNVITSQHKDANFQFVPHLYEGMIIVTHEIL